MTLHIEYNEDEYNSIKNRLIDKEKKTRKVCIVCGIPTLIIGIFMIMLTSIPFILSGITFFIGCIAAMIGLPLIIGGNNINIYNVYPSDPYEVFMFKLADYKLQLKIRDKKADGIFAKVGNGEVLAYYAGDSYNEKYISLNDFLSKFDISYAFKDDIPEQFEVLNLVAKEGTSEISFS